MFYRLCLGPSLVGNQGVVGPAREPFGWPITRCVHSFLKDWKATLCLDSKRDDLCHGTTSFPLLCLPPPTSVCLCLCPPTSIDVCLPSATTPKHTCSVLAQLCCTYHQTNFGSRPNMSGPSSHAKGCCTYALFPICPICLIPLHWQ